MANMDNFIVKITGELEKLEEIKEIVYAASYDGGDTGMESFLEEQNVNFGKTQIDADCHHISLFTYLLNLNQNAKELEILAGRNFLDGCSMENDSLTIYVYGPDGGKNFFKRIVELSPTITNCLVEEDKDYDEEDYDEEDYEC